MLLPQPPVSGVDADLELHVVGFASVGLDVVADVEGLEEFGIVANADGLVERGFVLLLNPSVLAEEVGAQGYGEGEVLVEYFVMGGDAEGVLAVAVGSADADFVLDFCGASCIAAEGVLQTEAGGVNAIVVEHGHEGRTPDGVKPQLPVVVADVVGRQVIASQEPFLVHGAEPDGRIDVEVCIGVEGLLGVLAQQLSAPGMGLSLVTVGTIDVAPCTECQPVGVGAFVGTVSGAVRHVLVLEPQAQFQFGRHPIAGIASEAEIERQVLAYHVVVHIAGCLIGTRAVGEAVLEQIAEGPFLVAVDVAAETDVCRPDISEARHVGRVSRVEPRVAVVQQLHACLQRRESEDAVIDADGCVERIGLRRHEETVVASPPSLHDFLAAHLDVEQVVHGSLAAYRVDELGDGVRLYSISAFCFHRNKRH